MQVNVMSVFLNTNFVFASVLMIFNEIRKPKAEHKKTEISEDQFRIHGVKVIIMYRVLPLIFFKNRGIASPPRFQCTPKQTN